MGGYGAYIWPAYGVATLVMLGLLATSIRASRTNARALAELESSGRTRRRARSADRGTPKLETPDRDTPGREIKEPGDDSQAS